MESRCVWKVGAKPALVGSAEFSTRDRSMDADEEIGEPDGRHRLAGFGQVAFVVFTLGLGASCACAVVTHAHHAPRFPGVLDFRDVR